MKNPFAWAVLALVLGGTAWTGTWCVRTWLHDRDLAIFGADPESARGLAALDAARRLRPLLDDAWRIEADALSTSDPQSARTMADRAVALDPWSLDNWRVKASLAYEDGDLLGARADLVEARRFDAGAQSHRMLANFAWVLRDYSAFWQEARAALATGMPIDVGPTLELCLRAGTDQAETVRAALASAPIPNRVAAVDYLIRANHLPDAVQVWQDGHCRPVDAEACRAAALELTSALVSEIQHAGAAGDSARDLVGIWNRAVADRYFDQDRAGFDRVTDGDFAHAWGERALGWSNDAPELVSMAPLGSPFGGAVRVGLSSNIADRVALFHEFVAVTPGAWFQLSFAAQAFNARSDGVAAVVLDGKGVLIGTVSAPNGPGWNTASGTFLLPKGSPPLILVQFVYERPSGVPLLQDTIKISAVALTSIPAPK